MCLKQGKQAMNGKIILSWLRTFIDAGACNLKFEELHESLLEGLFRMQKYNINIDYL